MWAIIIKFTNRNQIDNKKYLFPIKKVSNQIFEVQSTPNSKN